MYSRKQITFDLDTNVLKQIHGEKNYTKAYSDIRSFMENNDFEHIEGSVYASKNVMSNHKILKTVKKLKEKHEYLEKCVKDMHQTDIGESHSLGEHFSYDGTPGKFAQKYQENSSPAAPGSECNAKEDRPIVKNLKSRFASAENLTANINDYQGSKNNDYEPI